MAFLNFKKLKNQDKDKNIIDTQAPLHHVCTDVFKSFGAPLFKKDKYAKTKCKHYPENGLNKRFAQTDMRGFFTEQSKIERNGHNEHYTENKIANLGR